MGNAKSNHEHEKTKCENCMYLRKIKIRPDDVVYICHLNGMCLALNQFDADINLKKFPRECPLTKRIY